MDAPDPVRRFYDRVKGIDMDTLTAHSAYIEPRKDWFESNDNKRFKLKISLARSRELQQKYGLIQLACFDFIGRCVNCPEPSRHAHSVQATSVYEIEEFSGLFLYPRLLRNYLVLKDLLDQLLHQELASPTNSTNVHAEYHVTYPGRATDTGQQLSFFDPAASHLKMQPRLDDSWTLLPLTITAFVEKLRWLKMQLPNNIKSLIESIIPLEVNSGTALISSCTDTLDLRKDHENNGFFLNLSLGCDGVLVIGKKRGPDEPRKSGLPASPREVPEDNWHQWVVGLDDQDEDEQATNRNKPCHETDASTEDREKNEDSSINEDGYHLAAIRLGHGDALLFSGESTNAWHGVAKVLDGTFAAWEQDWPCWFAAKDSSPFQDWRGCMKGHRVDFVLH